MLHLGVSVVALMVGGTFETAYAQSTITLDPITVLATKTPESVWDSLSATSAVRQDEITTVQPRRVEDLLIGIPGVWSPVRADSPETSINIRGLQDFGRVATLIDGARQNFQRSGHNANGTFLVDPELLAGVDIVRGPVANIYGSGAIGGVASFRTLDVDDILRPGEAWGSKLHGQLASNPGNPLGSAFAAMRANPNLDFLVGGSARTNRDYKDGDGNTVPNTGYDLNSGLAKVTVRPADGHQIKLSAITQDTNFDTGQAGSSVYRTDMKNDIVSARWTYGRPDDRIFNYDANVYWTRTQLDQLKIAGGASPITGAIGDRRTFQIETTGFDLNNTSRFDTGAISHALTFGIDGFRDDVSNADPNGNGGVLTPNGVRSVWGGFAQLKMNWANFEWINALRYDSYELNGGGTNANGDRVSPKTTLGYTPFRGFQIYGTYAEGYRAPSTTETLAAGPHPGIFPGAPALFTLIPNSNLRPEIGHNLEAGVNIKYDNLVLANDKLRAKASVYRNVVDNYIDLFGFGPPVIVCVAPGVCFPVGPSFEQYRNIAQARLEGVEFEGLYDAGGWFAQLAASHVKGINVQTGGRLSTVTPDKVALTYGMRFFDRRLTTMVRWIGVDESKAGPSGQFTPVNVPGYGIVNLYATYEANKDVLLTFAVENLFDRQYVTFGSEAPLGGGGSVLLPSPGITFKGGLQVRFGEEFFKTKKG